MLDLARWTKGFVLAVALSLGASSVSAQAASPGATSAWVPPGETTPAPVDEEVATPRHHEVRPGLLYSGIGVWAAGYVIAIAWGAHYLGNLPMASLRCNDLYGGFHFLPIVGPLIGMFAGGSCVPDQLHPEEAVMPVLSTIPQLVGTILFAIGLAGHDVGDVPQVAVSFENDGAMLRVGGNF